MANYYPFISIPRRDSVNKQYLWFGLSIKMTGKGVSVFADMDIDPGLMIPYGGIEIFVDEYRQLQKSAGRHTVNYLAGGHMDDSGRYTSWLDAHPTRYAGNYEFAWIGSRINEPSPGEAVNCKLYSLISDGKVPPYPYISRKKGVLVVFVEVIEKICKGCELLVDYGWDQRSRERHQRHESACVSRDITYRDGASKEVLLKPSNDQIIKLTRKRKQAAHMNAIRKKRKVLGKPKGTF